MEGQTITLDVSTNTPNEETAHIPEADALPIQPFVIAETEWTQIKAFLDKRYTEISTLLRYNKTKDESIQRLGAEIQKYREGFAFSALKPFINALIALREDCRKSIRDAKQFSLDDEKAKKYIAYLSSDFEEMVSNIGLERDDNSISINGKPLVESTQPKELPAESLTSEQEDDDAASTLICAEAITSVAELIEYLNKSENAIRLALQDRSAADATIKEYIALAARTDAEYYLALTAPVARRLYALYDRISAKAALAKEYSGDELIQLYTDILEEASGGIARILTGAGIKMGSQDEAFDTQKHKLLKTIPTSDEKLDRVIANIYTDCYIYDEKIVYQSKVDVYKFQQE